MGRKHTWLRTDLPAEVNTALHAAVFGSLGRKNWPSGIAYFPSPTPLVAGNQPHRLALEEPRMKSKGISQQELGSTRDFILLKI